MDEDLARRFASYAEQKMPGVDRATVQHLERIHGGASRETYRIKLKTEGALGQQEHRLILRRDPIGSLIETDRENEFLAYRAFHGSGVPVPEAYFLEADESVLDRPFFVMEEITGGAAASPFAENPYGANRDKVGQQFWSILGQIHSRPVSEELRSAMDVPEPDKCWERELKHWEGVIDGDELEPHPIARAAIRKLRRDPPPPAERICVVHGDYRTGNFLVDEPGNIIAVLDWEMAHLGDPYEDLGWATDPLWAFNDASHPGSMIKTKDAIAIWEGETGLKFNPEAHAWWSLFNMVKGLAIWISSSKEFADGKNQDPVLAFSGWYCTTAHNQHLVKRLAKELERESANEA